MKQILITIAALVLVGCGESQQSTPASETKPEAATAKAPDISIHQATKEGNIEAVKQHLAAGTDVNAKNISGQTPLHCSWTKEVTELLIAKGADVHVKDKEGATPLHYAHSKECVELLIAKGADVNAKRDDGRTPLDFAKRKPEIADLLRKHGGKTGEELKAEGK